MQTLQRCFSSKESRIRGNAGLLKQNNKQGEIAIVIADHVW